MYRSLNLADKLRDLVPISDFKALNVSRVVLSSFKVEAEVLMSLGDRTVLSDINLSISFLAIFFGYSFDTRLPTRGSLPNYSG